jgi:hypothetical protein
VSGPDAGYLLDVEYTGDFYDHLAPAQLAYVAAINGLQPQAASAGSPLTRQSGSEDARRLRLFGLRT